MLRFRLYSFSFSLFRFGSCSHITFTNILLLPYEFRTYTYVFQVKTVYRRIRVNASFEVFTAVTMKNYVFRDVALCRSCVNRSFGGTYRHLLTGGGRARSFGLWRWGRFVPPKRRFTQNLLSATSQKTAFFIVTAVKTSNLTLTLILL
jgi:hypothetical protein